MAIDMTNPLRGITEERARTVVKEECSHYRYLSDRKDIRGKFRRFDRMPEDGISVPFQDQEIAVKVLTNIGEGRNCMVVSNSYNNSFSPYPLLITARPLLREFDYYPFLVIGGKAVWKSILESVYRHGDTGNHPLSSEHRFPDVSQVSHTTNGIGRKRIGKKQKWIFSGFMNSDQWDTLGNISLIVVDLVSDASDDPDQSSIMEILQYSTEHRVPVVFYLDNPWDQIYKYLSEKGLTQVYSNTSESSEGREWGKNLKTDTVISQDPALADFIKGYRTRVSNLRKNTGKRHITIQILNDDSILASIISKKNKAFNMLSGNEEDIAITKVKRISQKITSLTLSELGWTGHPRGDKMVAELAIPSMLTYLYRLIWVQGIGDEFREAIVDFGDSVRAFVDFYFDLPTQKGLELLDMINEVTQSGNSCTVVVASDELEDEYTSLLEINGIRGVDVRSYFTLRGSKEPDTAIFVDPPFGWSTNRLMLSSENVIILSYRYQAKAARNSTENVVNFIKSSSSKQGEGVDREGVSDDSNLIDVKVSGNVTEVSSKGREGTGKKSDMEMELDDSIVPEFNESWSGTDFDDFEEDIDDQTVEQYDGIESQEARYLIETESGPVRVPESRKIPTIRSGRTFMASPKNIWPGDIILVSKDFNPRPLSDYVWYIMKRAYGISREAHPGDEWRRKLKDYRDAHPEMTKSDILEQLKKMGDTTIMTTVALYEWLDYNEVIGPKSPGTVLAIARLTGCEDRYEDWLRGIRDIRSLHNKLMKHLWKIAKFNIKRLRRGAYDTENFYLDRKLKISISDLSKLMTFAEVTRRSVKIEE